MKLIVSMVNKLWAKKSQVMRDSKERRMASVSFRGSGTDELDLRIRPRGGILGRRS